MADVCRYPGCTATPRQPQPRASRPTIYCAEHRGHIDRQRRIRSNQRHRHRLRQGVMQAVSDRLRLTGWLVPEIPVYTISRRGFEALLGSRQERSA